MRSLKARKEHGLENKGSGKNTTISTRITNHRGVLQGSWLQCWATWARNVPKGKGKCKPICQYAIQEWFRHDNLILEEKLVKPEVPVLEDKHMAHENRLWEYGMGELMKTEKILEGNL